MKLVICLRKLAAGGFPMEVSTMANYWAERCHDVTILTTDAGSEPPFYRLHHNVNQISLEIGRYSRNLLETIWNNVYQVFALRKTIKRLKPDCVVSFQENINIRLFYATLGTKVPIILRVGNFPFEFLKWQRQWLICHSIVYSLAKNISVQTERTRMCFPKRVHNRITVIPNPINFDFVDSPPAEATLPAGKNIVWVGRVDWIKRLDLLLEAFSRVAHRHPCNLIIIGEGRARSHMEALGQEFGVADQVVFTGLMKDPWSLARKADIFVLSSEHEGMPNALIEAMACGMAVISSDCETGPRELITDGYDGLLVPPLDAEGLASAMERLLESEEERIQLGRNALKIRDRLSPQKVMTMWDSLVDRVVEEQSNTKKTGRVC